MEDKFNRDNCYLYCIFCDKQGLCNQCELIDQTGYLCPTCERQWACLDCHEAGKKWIACEGCEIEFRP